MSSQLEQPNQADHPRKRRRRRSRKKPDGSHRTPQAGRRAGATDVVPERTQDSTELPAPPPETSNWLHAAMWAADLLRGMLNSGNKREVALATFTWIVLVLLVPVAVVLTVLHPANAAVIGGLGVVAGGTTFTVRSIRRRALDRKQSNDSVDEKADGDRDAAPNGD